MRVLIGVLSLLAVAISCARAEPPPFHAAVTGISVQDVVPFEALIAYPTHAAKAPFQSGGFTIAAGRDAPIAGGTRFPIVLFSHGSGRSAGSSLLRGPVI